ncbi:hypothetical protein Tco_1027768, partial [Tanacetum coccineum]
MGGYKHNQLKSKSYEEIQKMFDNEMRRVNTFIPMDSELYVKKAECECEKAKGSRKKMLGRKRAGKEQQQESSKRQRMEDDKETDEHEEVEEDDEAELKKHLVIVKDDEIAIDAIPLATKPPVIVEYKLLKEGIMVHYQLIRADGSSKRYSSMIRMLQDIDREDLETLWKLVKTKHGDTRPEDEHERVLLGDLKVMFEPDIRSEVWRNLQGYTVTVWKLYDSCGVHFVRNLKIQKMNIKFRGGLLGLKRLQGFLELLLLSFAGTKVNADGLQLLEDYYCQEDKYGLRDKDLQQAQSLEYIFNRLQKIVSRLAILGVVIAQEDLNSKFLSSLPPEWNTHVVVWMNKAEIETMSIDDLYNNFKIVKQSVKKSVGASSGAQNLAFMTAPSTSSTNDVNTAKPAYEVSTVSPNVNTASPQDLEQIHEDDLEAIDLKWQLSLLSMRAKRWDTLPGNVEHQFKYQDNTRKQGNNEDTSSKAMLAIDGVAATYKRGLATVEEQLITYRKNEVLFSEEVAVLKREVACKDYEINVLKSEFEKVKQEKEGIEFKIEKFDNASKSLNKLLESQITDKSKKGLGYNAVPPPHPLIYNRPNKLDLSYSGLDEFKEPEFNSYGTKGGKKEPNIVCDKTSDASKENSDDSLVKGQVLEDKSSVVESSLNNDKETIFLDKKKVSVKPKNHEKPVKKSVRYDEMYRSQSPRGNQQNWNGQKSNQLGSNFVMYNKACFICGSFEHVQAHCKYHQRERVVYGNNYNRVYYNYSTNTTHPNAQRNMVPRAVLMKTGLKPFNTTKTVNTAHPKSIGKPLMNDKGFIDTGCSRHMTGNIAYLSDFKKFDGGYVTFGGGAHGGRISGKGTLKTDSLDFEDVYWYRIFTKGQKQSQNRQNRDWKEHKKSKSKSKVKDEADSKKILNGST